jgi:hypothetical protein
MRLSPIRPWSVKHANAPRGCRSDQLGEDDDEGEGGERKSAGQILACSCVQCGGGRRFSPERSHRKPHGGTHQQRDHDPPHTATLSARRIAGAGSESGSAVTLTDDRWRWRAAPLRLFFRLPGARGRRGATSAGRVQVRVRVSPLVRRSSRPSALLTARRPLCLEPVSRRQAVRSWRMSRRPVSRGAGWRGLCHRGVGRVAPPR